MKTEVFILGKLILFDPQKKVAKISTGKKSEEYYVYFERDTRFLLTIQKLEKIVPGCYVSIKGRLGCTEKTKKIKIICTNISNVELTQSERKQISLFENEE